LLGLLNNMEGEPLGRLGPDPRQPAQLLHQAGQGSEQHHQNSPGSPGTFRPPVTLAISCAASSRACARASLTAFKPRSCRSSTSAGSMTTSTSSWWPLATTRTAPPPAEPSTRRLASSSCRRAISACIRWTCFIILLKLATPAPSPEGSLFGSVTGVLALHPDHMAPEELHGLADQRILQSLDVDRRRLLALRRPARPPLPGLARGRPLPSGRPHLLGQILLRGDVEPDRAAHLPAEHAPNPVLVGLLAQVGPVKLVALGEDQISIVPLEGGQPGLPGEGVGRPAGGGAVQLGQHPLPEARQIGCLAGRGPSLPARGGRTRPS